jgi:hypothetical protein
LVHKYRIGVDRVVGGEYKKQTTIVVFEKRGDVLAQDLLKLPLCKAPLGPREEVTGLSAH